MQTPEAPELSARIKTRHLVLLAAASLSLAFGVECLGLLAQWFSQTNTSVHWLEETAVFVLQAGSGVLVLTAAMAGVAPAVLAEGHHLLRCMLAGAHLLVAWATLTVSYLAFRQFGAEFVAEMCVSNLVGLLGIFAGLAVGIFLFAALWGWLLTHRVGDAKRPTFSLRGIMTATAAAALLFASPRMVRPPVTGAINRIYDYFDLHPYQPATVILGDANSDGVPLVSLVLGLVFAITLASAMCVRRSRWGWLGLSLGTIVVGTFVFAVGSISGSGAAPPSFAIVLAVTLFVGSLQATLQTRLWEAFGWRLVRVRSGPSGSETH